MRRAFWTTITFVGLALLAAACDPFATPGPDDYVVFERCIASQPCQTGTKNILLMKKPVTTTVGGRTVRHGEMQLRVMGRDGAFHDYRFPGSTVTEDSADPSRSSIEIGPGSGAVGGPGWDDAVGVGGLDLSGVSLTGVQDTAGDWTVDLKATSAYSSPAARQLVPGHALLASQPQYAGILLALANRYSATISDAEVPMTVSAQVDDIDLGTMGADRVVLTKTSWPGHSLTTGVVEGASGDVGPVALSGVNATIAVDDLLTGHIDVRATVTSAGLTLPVAVDFPVHLDLGAAPPAIVAGPNASLSVGTAPNQVALTGTFAVPFGGPGFSLEITDATLGWGTTEIPVTGHIASGAQGFEASLHAGTAQLTPAVSLTDADLTWSANTLAVNASAALTGPVASGDLSVSGTATLTAGNPSMNLAVTSPLVTFALPGGTNRTAKVEDAAFSLSGNFTGGNVSLSAGRFAVAPGLLGATAVTGDLDVTGRIALGPNFTVQGWRADSTAAVKLGAFDTDATIHGSGGTLYDGPAGPDASLTAVLSIIDPGRGIGGVLRATLWYDATGTLHLDAAGNAHVTLGAKVVIEGTVTITDNVITVSALARLGTSLQVSVTGTITVDPSNLTAVPAVDLTVNRLYISDRLWVDDVRITNSASLTTFTVTGRITNNIALRFLGLTVFDLGDLNVNGTVSLAGGDLSNATSGTIGYDLRINAGNSTPKSIVVAFSVDRSSLDFHVWGNNHIGNVDLDVQAVFGSMGLIDAGAAGRLQLGGSANFDTGAVSVTGHAGAAVMASALGVTASGSAGLNLSLTGNLNTTLTLQGSGTGRAGANFIGIPVASGDVNLGGSVTMSMTDGTLSGSAYVNWSIDVVGGLFGNNDGDWQYSVAGTSSTPVVTAHNSYWRDNHYRATNINGQISPVKNLCGTHQHRGTTHGWHTIGQWGDCNTMGQVTGTVVVDTDRSGTLNGPDAPIPAPDNAVVRITDRADGSLVGQAETDDDGTFNAAVAVRPGHTYSVSFVLPGGYKRTGGTGGYATTAPSAHDVYLGGQAYQITSPAGANQTVDSGTFGVVVVDWGSLTGSVYDDQNGNGSRDAGEPGKAGVTVMVTITDAADRTAVTDSFGNYDMNTLDPDTATTLTLIVPDGWYLSGDPDGTIDGTTEIAMTGGQVATIGAFGLCQSQGCSTGTVHSWAYYVTSEGAPLRNDDVTLRYFGIGAGNGGVTGEVRVTADGRWSLTNLPSGLYAVMISTSPTFHAITCPPEDMGTNCGTEFRVQVPPRASATLPEYTIWRSPQPGETPLHPWMW